MQHLYTCPKKGVSLHLSGTVQAQVRFFAYHRIKPHAPPLVRAPVNFFEFHPCGRTPQAVYLMRLQTKLFGGNGSFVFWVLFSENSYV